MDFLNGIIESLSPALGDRIPTILGALAVLIIGWMVAKFIAGLVKRGLRSTDLDNRLFKGAKSSVSPEGFISKLVYYILMLLVLMTVLEMLGLKNVLDPIKDMVGQFLGFIPNLVAAGIIGFAGYMIASIVSELFGFAGGKADEMSAKLGLSSDIDLGGLVKQVIFVLIFVPILITAISQLGMNTISDPLTSMLTTMIEYIPKIIAAAIIVGVFYYGGTFISTIVKDLLKSLGTDNMASKMGISGMIGEGSSLSDMISKLIFFFLIFTGVVAATNTLGFDQLSDTLNGMYLLAGNIAFGLLIMVLGNFLATTVAKNVNDDFLATLARVCILGLFLAIALNRMGIADEIVNLAFGLTLGAVAVAFALSFGLGGREAAGKTMSNFLGKFNK